MFQFGVGAPSEHRIGAFLFYEESFDQLFKTNYGKGTSNEDLMRESGFVEIFDCGQLTFLLAL